MKWLFHCPIERIAHLNSQRLYLLQLFHTKMEMQFNSNPIHSKQNRLSICESNLNALFFYYSLLFCFRTWKTWKWSTIKTKKRKKSIVNQLAIHNHTQLNYCFGHQLQEVAPINFSLRCWGGWARFRGVSPRACVGGSELLSGSVIPNCSTFENGQREKRKQ